MQNFKILQELHPIPGKAPEQELNTANCLEDLETDDQLAHPETDDHVTQQENDDQRPENFEVEHLSIFISVPLLLMDYESS